MIAKRSTVTCFLAILASSRAAAVLRRDTGITLFAYGVGQSVDAEVNGFPVFYADGLAYIGRTALTSATLSTNITITADPTSTTVPWTIAANSTTTSFNDTLNVYIIPTAGLFSQVGFATNDNLPTNAVTTGLTFMGTSVDFAPSDSEIQAQFAAAPANETGIFALYWNGASATPLDGSFPVTLKSTPPTVVNLD